VITNPALWVWSSYCTIVISSLAQVITYPIYQACSSDHHFAQLWSETWLFSSPFWSLWTLTEHSQLSDLEPLSSHVINTRSEDAVLLHLWSYLDYHAVNSTVWHNQDQLIPTLYDDDDKVSTHISCNKFIIAASWSAPMLCTSTSDHRCPFHPVSLYFSLKLWSSLKLFLWLDKLLLELRPSLWLDKILMINSEADTYQK